MYNITNNFRQLLYIFLHKTAISILFDLPLPVRAKLALKD